MLTSGIVRRLARVSCALLLIAVGYGTVSEVRAQSDPGRARRQNTWAATSSTGLQLAGTWTAKADQATGTVTGTWTLVNAQGRTAARGAWSAAKSPSGWTGGWRAVAEGRSGEYSGTWTARADFKADAPLPDLFAKAIESAVSGTWRAGRPSGAWTIQAFK